MTETFENTAEAGIRLLVDELAEMNSLLRRALTAILDAAEARNYEPPADTLLVADLEYAIAVTTDRAA